MNYIENYKYTRKVYYYETDNMGIVHHSNYVRWLEETRIDMLDKAGYSFDRMESEGVMIPALSVECHYKYPLKFGDTFEVYPTITSFNGCKMTVEYEVYNATAGKLSAVCKSEHCLTNLDLRPIRSQKKHPDIYKVFNDAVLYGKKEK
ncbi:MAG: acyl-CoA thioesterase [Ruminococcus sp.]|nr:acyl-CoA thioesterase [Ruminococcus sp.]